MSASAKQLLDIVDNAIKRYQGHSGRLSNAIGYLFIGRNFGWRVMFMMHDRKSIKDYEAILRIDSRAFFPEEGPLADKSLAHAGLKKVTNFWKAVRGEIPGVRSSEIK
jgi:hypothetical protein